MNWRMTQQRVNHWLILHHWRHNTALAIFLISNAHNALLYSCVTTVICLFIFGYYKSKMTGQPALKGALKVVIIGALAAAAAFGIAH